MKKLLILIMVLVVSNLLWGATYTQRVNITSGTGNQEIEFDYYNHGHNLTNVNVRLYTTVSGGDNAADNDADETVDVTIHLGATFSLTDRYDEFEFPNLPRLLDTEGSPNNIWSNATETTWDDELQPENGDGATFDNTSPDGVYHSGLSLNDTKVDDIYTPAITKYVGEGTFIFDLAKTQSNSIDTEGSAVAGQYNPVSIGGYVEIIYTDDDPLPVELSEFAAIEINNEFAQLRWTTESATDVNGFNIYRAEKEDFETATIVNPNLIEAVNSTIEQEYSFTDVTVEYETDYFYWLESVDMSGATELFGPIDIRIENNQDNPEPPDVNDNLRTAIQDIYPNPFNPSTSISYYLEEGSAVTIDVFNIHGQKIYTFNEGYKSGNAIHRVTWNGKNMNQSDVSSGIYLFRLKTAQGLSVKKALLQK